jgi:hypothetical protein
MSLHKQLVMESACGTEECHEAGLGTPSALLDADRVSPCHIDRVPRVTLIVTLHNGGM